MTSPEQDNEHPDPSAQGDEVEKSRPRAALSKSELLEAAASLEPQEQAEVLAQIVTSISMQGPFPDPIKSKVTEQHISAAIRGAQEHDERQYHLLKQRENRQDSNRWFALGVFVLVLIAVGLLCVGFRNDPDTLKQILTLVLGFGAGAIAGYGYGQSKRE